MANANQVYTILNNISKQMFGSTAPTVTDTSGVVALGNTVLSSETNKDVFWKTLVDRIGRTIFSIRRYEETDENVVKHAFDFGLIMQKIYVELPQIQQNTSWLIGEDDFVPQYAPVIKPNVKQKLFDSLNVFDIDVTIPDAILKTAFIDAAAMGTMISAVFVAVDNMLSITAEALVNLTRASFIARKLNKGSKCGAINLLAGYNTLFGTSLTAAKALTDQAFLKYAAMQISLWTRRMRKMSVLFNDEGYQRHTPNADLVLTVLDEYASASAAYLEADTYHKELVSLPRYNSVAFWQFSGQEFAFADTSKVSVQLDASTTVTQSGVLAVAYDYEALGAMIDRQYSETERNSRSQYTNYYNKVERGMFNDMSENGIVFYIADPAPTPPSPTSVQSDAAVDANTLPPVQSVNIAKAATSTKAAKK